MSVVTFTLEIGQRFTPFPLTSGLVPGVVCHLFPSTDLPSLGSVKSPGSPLALGSLTFSAREKLLMSLAKTEVIIFIPSQEGADRGGTCRITKN